MLRLDLEATLSRGFFVGEADDLLRSGCDTTVIRGCGGWSDPDDVFDARPDSIGGDAERLQDVGGQADRLASNPEQDVLSADIFVLKPGCFVTGQAHDILRAF